MVGIAEEAGRERVRMKWHARVLFDREGIQTVTVEAKTADEAEKIFYNWFCDTYAYSNGVMYNDYSRLGDWKPCAENNKGRE